MLYCSWRCVTLVWWYSNFKCKLRWVEWRLEVKWYGVIWHVQYNVSVAKQTEHFPYNQSTSTCHSVSLSLSVLYLETTSSKIKKWVWVWSSRHTGSMLGMECKESKQFTTGSKRWFPLLVFLVISYVKWSAVLAYSSLMFPKFAQVGEIEVMEVEVAWRACWHFRNE